MDNIQANKTESDKIVMQYESIRMLWPVREDQVSYEIYGVRSRITVLYAYIEHSLPNRNETETYLCMGEYAPHRIFHLGTNYVIEKSPKELFKELEGDKVSLNKDIYEINNLSIWVDMNDGKKISIFDLPDDKVDYIQIDFANKYLVDGEYEKALNIFNECPLYCTELVIGKAKALIGLEENFKAYLELKVGLYRFNDERIEVFLDEYAKSPNLERAFEDTSQYEYRKGYYSNLLMHLEDGYKLTGSQRLGALLKTYQSDQRIIDHYKDVDGYIRRNDYIVAVRILAKGYNYTGNAEIKELYEKYRNCDEYIEKVMGEYEKYVSAGNFSTAKKVLSVQYEISGAEIFKKILDDFNKS